jgi:hypothetical protein
MKLSTGKVAFPIEFDNGNKTAIYFNPNDPDLFIRIKNFEGIVLERIKEFGEIELSNDGTPIKTEEIETFEKMQNILKEELDRAFGGEISGEVFKYCSPFAIVGGEYFIMQFIKAITPEIGKHIQKASAERMAKHLDKYGK